MRQAYHSEDITFCSSECNRTSCFRHPSNIRDKFREHSVADLKGTVHCQIRPEPVRRSRKRRPGQRKK